MRGYETGQPWGGAEAVGVGRKEFVIMAMDLVRADGRRLRLGFRPWASALCLGLRYGWVPARTAYDADRVRRRLAGVGGGGGDLSAEDEAEVAGVAAGWDGSYTSNSGQTVSGTDALALADALERAVAHMPEPGEPGWRSMTIELPVGDAIEFLRPEEAASPFDAFAGDGGRETLEALIDFCRRGGGGFRID